MTYVFDLDGTLVDTRLAVEKAYAYAGVVMPEFAWGRPWYEWLDDAQVHAVKTRVYPQFVKQFATPMPLFEHALRLNALVITGASVSAVLAIQQAFAPTLRVALTGASLAEKIEFLNFMPGPLTGIYVDDNAQARCDIARETRWQVQTPAECLQSF